MAASFYLFKILFAFSKTESLSALQEKAPTASDMMMRFQETMISEPVYVYGSKRKIWKSSDIFFPSHTMSSLIQKSDPIIPTVCGKEEVS